MKREETETLMAGAKDRARASIQKWMANPRVRAVLRRGDPKRPRDAARLSALKERSDGEG